MCPCIHVCVCVCMYVCVNCFKNRQQTIPQAYKSTSVQTSTHFILDGSFVELSKRHGVNDISSCRPAPATCCGLQQLSDALTGVRFESLVLGGGRENIRITTEIFPYHLINHKS